MSQEKGTVEKKKINKFWIRAKFGVLRWKRSIQVKEFESKRGK